MSMASGASKGARELRIAQGKEIPREIQEPIRERLRLLRLSRGRQQVDLDQSIHLIAPTTLANFENHDISTIRLYHLYGLAKFLDINFLELIAYLFDVESNDTLLATRQTNTDRMSRLLGYLSEDDQKLALTLVDAVVESRGKVAREAVTKDRARRGDGGVQGVQATATARA